MKEQLITFDTAKLAKEKGFDWDCIYAYLEPDDEPIYYKKNGHNWNGREKLLKATDKFCSAPTQSLLQKWLREVHNIHIWLTYIGSDINDKEGYIRNLCKGKTDPVRHSFSITGKTYEEALETGLQEALKLIQL